MFISVIIAFQLEPVGPFCSHLWHQGIFAHNTAAFFGLISLNPGDGCA